MKPHNRKTYLCVTQSFLVIGPLSPFVLYHSFKSMMLVFQGTYLGQWFSNLHVHQNHLEKDFFSCSLSFWSSRFGMQPNNLHF
jgi:hypothetical protein